MTTPNLSLSPFINVSYTINVPTQGVVGFNQGLIITNETTLTLPSNRVAVYPNLAAMVTAGFSTSGPAYHAAQIYFAQTPTPTNVVIGVQGTMANGGVDETILQAFEACRATNTPWYMGYCPQAVDADHEAIAAFVEAQGQPFTTYILNTNDSAVLNNTGGNLFATLKASNYSRTQGIYSTNANIAASVMGYVAANTNSTNGSAYILADKALPGCTPEALSETQWLGITGNNGNAYITTQGTTWYQTGTQFNGQWFDNVVLGDLLIYEAQATIAAYRQSVSKIPQTEAGMATVKGILNSEGTQLASAGWLAEGPWDAAPVSNISTGDLLAGGFQVFSDPIATQTESQRSQRISPYIYFLCKTAGGLQFLNIKINVNL